MGDFTQAVRQPISPTDSSENAETVDRSTSVIDALSLSDACRLFHALPNEELDRLRLFVPEQIGELMEIRQALIELEERQVAAQHALTRARSLLAPIRKLPRDLLLEIFQFVVSPANVLQENLLPSVTILAEVCAVWRLNIIEVPSLWTHWELRLGQAHFIDHFRPSKLAEYIETSFRRSQSMPLTVNIFAVAPVPRIILDILLQHAPQLEHFGFFTTTHIATYAPLQVPSESLSFPLLRTVDVPAIWAAAGLGDERHRATPWASFNVMTGPLPSHSLFTCLMKAQGLQNLHADMLMLHISSQSVLPFLWSQLQCLHLENVRLTRATRSIFRSATSLKTLDLTFDAVMRQVPPPISPAELPLLETLTLSLNHPGSERFLEWITCPSLRCLDLYQDILRHSLPLNPDWQSSLLSSFLKSSQCALSALKLTQLCVTDDLIIEILIQIGLSLTELELNETGHITDRLLEWLTFKTEEASEAQCDLAQTGILPFLAILSLRGAPQRTPGVLTKMVRSRCSSADQEEQRNTVTSLSQVIIRDDDVDVFDLLQLSREGPKPGLELHLLPQLESLPQTTPLDDWLRPYRVAPPKQIAAIH